MPSAISSFSFCVTARSPTKGAAVLNTNWIWRKRASRTGVKMAAAGCRDYGRGSERTLAFYRDASARAGMRPVVPHCSVLRATIVPEGNCIFGPAETALEQRILCMLIKIGQYGIAFVTRNVNDMVRKTAVHIECFLPGDRMRSYDRMFGAWISRLVGNAGIRIKTTINRFSIVDRGESMEISLHSV